MNTWDENVYSNAIVQHVFFECRFDNRKRQPTILWHLTTKYVLRINMKRMVSSFSLFLSLCMHYHRDTKIIYIWITDYIYIHLYVYNSYVQPFFLHWKTITHKRHFNPLIKTFRYLILHSIYFLLHTIH